MRASELEESAVDELKRKLPSLNKTDYDTIDHLMRRISKRHHITGKKLHDMFVAKYKHTPDHWIKKYKEKLKETDKVEEGNPNLMVNPNPAKVYIVYGNGKPVVKFSNPKDADSAARSLRSKFRDITYTIVTKDEHGRVFEDSLKPEDENDRIKHFINWAYKIVNLQKPYPKFTFSADTEEAQQGSHTGRHSHDGTRGEIWVYTANRNLIDILRTVFHEIVHEKQMQLDMIKPGDSYPGSPIEVMADMLAGKYIKIYGKKHPEIFQ
jgi:hypothetical protein